MVSMSSKPYSKIQDLSLVLELLKSSLRDEWKVNFEFGRRRVSFRECLGSGDVSGVSDRWSTDIGGQSIQVKVGLSVRALEEGEEGDPLWDGNVVLDAKG